MTISEVTIYYSKSARSNSFTSRFFMGESEISESNVQQSMRSDVTIDLIRFQSLNGDQTNNVEMVIRKNGADLSTPLVITAGNITTVQTGEIVEALKDDLVNYQIRGGDGVNRLDWRVSFRMRFDPE